MFCDRSKAASGSVITSKIAAITPAGGVGEAQLARYEMEVLVVCRCPSSRRMRSDADLICSFPSIDVSDDMNRHLPQPRNQPCKPRASLVERAKENCCLLFSYLA